MTPLLPVDPERPADAVVARAVAVLRSGGVVALPTETFYGLAARPEDTAALERLNRLKGRPSSSPLLLLAGDVESVAAVATALPPPFAALAAAFWPGPLTLVVPGRGDLPREVTGPDGGVAVRVPGLALPRAVALALGSTITGTSANAHGFPPPRTAGEVAAAFPVGLDLVLDGGTTTGGAPSTLVDLTGGRPRILREGRVTASELARFL